MEISFNRTNGRLDELLDEILQLTAVHHPEMIREIVLNALKAGQEVDYLADLKMMRTTLREMRNTTRLFGPYRGRKKVTIFGSARTGPEEPIYQKCVTFARQLNRLGYMVITGGGPGIMQAGNEGAGPENSFAVNIRLPFEQETNPVMENSRNVITYKYFFNRKVAFLKEAHAVALFPGGFGTLDEAMETLTLVQTGKNPPIPLVLIDDDDGELLGAVVRVPARHPAHPRPDLRGRFRPVHHHPRPVRGGPGDQRLLPGLPLVALCRQHPGDSPEQAAFP